MRSCRELFSATPAEDERLRFELLANEKGLAVGRTYLPDRRRRCGRARAAGASDPNRGTERGRRRGCRRLAGGHRQMVSLNPMNHAAVPAFGRALPSLELPVATLTATAPPPHLVMFGPDLDIPRVGAPRCWLDSQADEPRPVASESQPGCPVYPSHPLPSVLSWRNA